MIVPVPLSLWWLAIEAEQKHATGAQYECEINSAAPTIPTEPNLIDVETRLHALQHVDKGRILEMGKRLAVCEHLPAGEMILGQLTFIGVKKLLVRKETNWTDIHSQLESDVAANDYAATE